MNILTIGELKEVLKDNVQKQIITTRDEIGINYIGIRHLFRGSTFLPETETDELVPTSSPYANADLALTFFKTAKFTIVYSLGVSRYCRR